MASRSASQPCPGTFFTPGQYGGETGSLGWANCQVGHLVSNRSASLRMVGGGQGCQFLSALLHLCDTLSGRGFKECLVLPSKLFFEKEAASPSQALSVFQSRELKSRPLLSRFVQTVITPGEANPGNNPGVSHRVLEPGG